MHILLFWLERQLSLQWNNLKEHWISVRSLDTNLERVTSNLLLVSELPTSPQPNLMIKWDGTFKSNKLRGGNRYSNKYLYTLVHNSTIHNSQEIEAVMSTNTWIDNTWIYSVQCIYTHTLYIAYIYTQYIYIYTQYIYIHTLHIYTHYIYSVPCIYILHTYTVCVYIHIYK